MENPWAAGPNVRETAPEVKANVNVIKNFFPEIDNHISAFDKLNSRLIFAKSVDTSDFKKAYGFLLVRFSSTIENSFGITQEVPIIYLPYIDLQKRSFLDALNQFKREKPSISYDKVIFFSKDSRAATKLPKWSEENDSINYCLIFSLGTKFDENIFIQKLSETIYTKNLFEASVPVAGSNFFGRGEILQKIQSDIDSNKCVGIFGLRKSGKTSLINEIRLRNKNTLFAGVDLEHIPFEPEEQASWIIDQFGKSIRKLADNGISTINLDELEIPEKRTVDKFQSILSRIIRKIPPGSRLCLVLDEIEHISPATDAESDNKISPETVRLIGMLRYLNQNNNNFTFMICGLSNSINKKHYLNDRDNPVFSYITEHYLGPMSNPECNNMAKKISSKMAISINSEILEYLYRLSAGHPYMYRELAKLSVNTLNNRISIADNPGVTRKMVKEDATSNLMEWRLSVADLVSNNRIQLEKYYVDEFLLLEILESGNYEDFLDQSEDYELELYRLMKLGAIYINQDGKYMISKIISSRRNK